MLFVFNIQAFAKEIEEDAPLNIFNLPACRPVLLARWLRGGVFPLSTKGISRLV